MVKLGTKAEILELLSAVLCTAKVQPQVRISSLDWPIKKNQLIEKLDQLNWLNIPLIVRSSAVHEDSLEESMAGSFLSVLDVLGEKHIIAAIQDVFLSYCDVHPDNQVFLQPMLQKVVHSGVAFSRDPNTGGFCYVINYDDKTGSTNSVTSGQFNELETYFYYQNAAYKPDRNLSKIITLIDELQELLQSDQLDIEYAITEDGEIYLFQVRPLILKLDEPVSREIQYKALDEITEKVKSLSKPHPYLYGEKSVFGIMPDWNPAEIIGVRPRPISLSLYREIVTDNIWALQRARYGYKDVIGFPLLIDFYGLPYIDVRVSFNSFIPSDIPDMLAERLCNYYLDKLVKMPSYHDKVEFEIVLSCFSFDLDARLVELVDHGFTKKETLKLKDSLRRLTNNIINKEKPLWKEELTAIEQLDKRRQNVLSSNLDIPAKVYWLIEDCKKFGTLPFAGLARSGFIAVQLLQSLVSVGILQSEDYECFMASLNTVSSRMNRDFESISKEEFLSYYGHLRPGTYNILSPRYDEDPEKYFKWSDDKIESGEEKPIHSFSKEQNELIEELLLEHGLQLNTTELISFIKEAIEGREYAKFIFSKNLSDALALINDWGNNLGFSSEQCSFADISIIHKLMASSASAATLMKKSIEEGVQKFSVTKQLTLPPLITDAQDIWCFKLPVCEPNYITQKSITGRTVKISIEQEQLKDGILFIPSADPGYDFIFSRKIRGFITMYGGVNSHMAIRAGELGIPAIIGAGETLYTKWANSKVLEMDCENRMVRIIS